MVMVNEDLMVKKKTSPSLLEIKQGANVYFREEGYHENQGSCFKRT